MNTILDNEALLIGSAMNGDLNAFNRLVLANQDAVFNTALRIMNDEDLANDITQTAFISAWKHLSSFKGTTFKPWIIRITINACYDELRKIRRHPTTPLEPAAPDDSENEIEDKEWMIDKTKSPSQQIEDKDLMESVDDCLKKLTEEYRIIITLIDVNEMSYEEASEIIKKPLGTVKSRLLRARLRLRDCIQSKNSLL